MTRESLGTLGEAFLLVAPWLRRVRRRGRLFAVVTFTLLAAPTLFAELPAEQTAVPAEVR